MYLELKELKKVIIEAKDTKNKLDNLLSEIYKILDDLNIDTFAKINTQNTDNLGELINCYIHDNKYDIKDILEEIKNQLKNNRS